MAHSSVLSTMAHQSTSSTGLPRPSGSTLIGRRPALSSGLNFSGFTLSLRSPGSVGLLRPSLRLHLGPLSLQLHCGLLEPRLRLGWLSHLLLGPPDPLHNPGSAALHLHLGGPLPPAPPLSVGPLESSALTPPLLPPLLAPPWADLSLLVSVLAVFALFSL